MTEIDLEYTPTITPITDVRLHNSLTFHTPQPTHDTPEAARTAFVIEWVQRMANRFGGVVFDYSLNRNWDWGQALCRQVYGPGWSHMEMPDDPTEEAVEEAKAWADGVWPRWTMEG